MRTTWRLAAVLALASAVRVANLATLADHPLAEYQADWTDADMSVNVEWADGIRGGDLLCRDTVHPFYPYHEAIAPRETWERWWGGARVFQQAPLYAYYLAGVRALGGEGFWAMALGQLALGLASVALVFLVAARTFGVGVATLAGVGVAVYGPLVLHEAVWLRDTLAVTTSLLALWTLQRAPEGRRGRWLAAGLALASALLARETALLLVPVAALWAWGRLAGGRRAGALVALGLGVLLGVLPLLARNVAVGAPALSFSNRGPESFVNGNAADTRVPDFFLAPSAREILPAADGSLLKTMWLTLATHGSVGRFLRWELDKAMAILSSYEATDNVSWYYYRDRSWVLRLSPGFALVLGLGLVGLVLEWRRGPNERLLHWFLLVTFLGILFGTLAGRYRLAGVAVLTMYAAAALASAVERVRERRWTPASGILLAALALAFASTRLYADTRARNAYRPTEPMLAALTYQRRQQPELALAELRAALARPGRDRQQLALLFVRIAGKAARPEVEPEVAALLAEFPADGPLRRLAAEYYRDVLHQPQRAAELLEAAQRRPPPSSDG